MKRDLWKTIHLAIYIFLFILLVAMAIFFGLSTVEAEAYPTFQPIPFEEQIKHDEEVAYLEWLLSHKEQSECRDCSMSETEGYLIEVTPEEIDLMARVVMSEASTLSSDAKQAIATTIVNRVRDKESDFRNQNTVTEVVYHVNAYSTSDNGEPNEDCYEAVYNALRYEAFPTDMFMFREDKYHEHDKPGFERIKPYAKIGTTYFSRITNE